MLTGGAEDDVQVLVLAVFGFDALLGDALNGRGDEIDLPKEAKRGVQTMAQRSSPTQATYVVFAQGFQVAWPRREPPTRDGEVRNH